MLSLSFLQTSGVREILSNVVYGMIIGHILIAVYNLVYAASSIISPEVLYRPFIPVSLDPFMIICIFLKIDKIMV